MKPEAIKKNLEKIPLFEEAIAATTCGVTIADARDPEMPLVYANGTFTKITGYPVEEVIGKNCRFLQGNKRDQEARKQIRDAIEHGRSITVLLENYRKDGSHFWNELNLSPVHKDGKVTHFVGIQNDVTERVESKLAMEESNRELEKLNRALKESDEAKERLLGMAAHDLRGPLGSIRSLIELSQDSSEEETAEILKTAERVAENSLQLVNDILDLSAIKSGRVKIEREETDLDRLVEDFSRIAKMMAREKGIRFETEKDLPFDKAMIDKERINQVLNNLLTNAIKYSPRESRIRFTAASTEDQLVFEMQDEGVGIDKENLPGLFEAFQRADSTPTEGEPSTGLGLAIVKRTLDLHDGSIEVESEVGEGSCFRVMLPLGMA